MCQAPRHTCWSRCGLWSGFEMSLSHLHLQPARGCALQTASRKDYTQGKEHFSLHTWRSWVGSLTCLLQRLPEYSSLVVSRVNGKVIGDVTSIFCHSVTCLGDRQCCWEGNHMPGCHECSPVRVCNVQLVIWFQSSLSHETLATCTLLRLQIAFKKGLHTRKGARLTSHLNTLAGSLPQGTISTTHFADKSTGASGMATRFRWDGTPHELDGQACTLASCKAVPYLLGRRKHAARDSSA